MLNFLPAVTRAKALALRDSPDELAKFLRCAELHPELHAQAAQALGLDAPQDGRSAAQAPSMLQSDSFVLHGPTP